MKNKILVIICLFIFSTSYSQIIELNINSHIAGNDEVLDLDSDIIINKNENTIEYSQGGMYSSRIRLNIVGFSYNDNILTVNFSKLNDNFITPGTLIANFSTNKLSFQAISIIGRGKGGIGYFNFTTAKITSKEDVDAMKKREKDLIIQEDNLTTNTINSLLKFKNFERAAEIYSELHFANQELKNKIINSFYTHIESNNITFEIDTLKLKEIINKIKVNLDTLKDGKLSLNINQLGEIRLNSIKVDSNFVLYKNFGKKKERLITIPVPCNAEFNFSSNLSPTSISLDRSFFVYEYGDTYALVQKKNKKEVVLRLGQSYNEKKYPVTIKVFGKEGVKKIKEGSYQIRKNDLDIILERYDKSLHYVKVNYSKIILVNGKEISRIEKFSKLVKHKF